jgi:S1/P1 Nuclease
VLLLQAIPAAGWAWGSRGHQIINRAAVEALPQPLRAWFQARVEYLVEHASDPDLLAHSDPEERPHHYTDADAYDQFPFARLRRQFVVQRRPPTAFEMRQGTAIWEIDIFTRRLEEDFRGRRWRRANHDAVFLAHYAGDITQPLHTTKNYDGQFTGQRGVHSRFETEMVNALADRWGLQVAPAATIPHLDARIFDEYVRSYSKIVLVLAADRKAVSGLSYDNPVYFTRFCALAGPLAEKRLEDAATFVGSLWYTAWVRAGRPDLSGWTIPRSAPVYAPYAPARRPWSMRHSTRRFAKDGSEASSD